MACRRLQVVPGSSLAFTTLSCMLPHRDRDADTTPLQRRTGSRGPARPSHPKVTSTRWTPLLGFIDRPSADTPSLRSLPPGPSPWLRLGTATSRARSALAVPPGFSGFLRSGSIRRSIRSTARGFVAPRSRPWGSPRFGLSGTAFRPTVDPEVVDPKVRRVFPCGEYPTKRSPPR